jgi:hypothetical protein
MRYRREADGVRRSWAKSAGRIDPSAILADVTEPSAKSREATAPSAISAECTAEEAILGAVTEFVPRSSALIVPVRMSRP